MPKTHIMKDDRYTHCSQTGRGPHASVYAVGNEEVSASMLDRSITCRRCARGFRRHLTSSSVLRARFGDAARSIPAPVPEPVQRLFRAEGYAAGHQRFTGILAPATLPTDADERVAYLDGLLAALDSSRREIVAEREAAWRRLAGSLAC